MAVVKIAKSRGSRDVIGAADEMNGLNQGHLQGQEAVNFNSLSSSERSLKRHWIMAAYSSGLQHGQSTNAFIITVIDHRNVHTELSHTESRVRHIQRQSEVALCC